MRVESELDIRGEFARIRQQNHRNRVVRLWVGIALIGTGGAGLMMLLHGVLQ